MASISRDANGTKRVLFTDATASVEACGWGRHRQRRLKVSGFALKPYWRRRNCINRPMLNCANGCANFPSECTNA